MPVFWIYTILILILGVPAAYKRYKAYAATKRLLRDTPAIKAGLVATPTLSQLV